MNRELLRSSETGSDVIDAVPVNEPRVLLSVEAAAERLSMSRTRVYGLIKSGDLGSVRVGRLRRIPIDALLQYVARLLAEQSNHRDVAA